MHRCGSVHPQHLESFEDGSVDVFLNIASFQEMTDAQVNHYFKIIDRVTAGTFYTQQRVCKGIHFSRETYPYLSSWKRLFSRTTMPVPYLFEDAFSVE